MEVRSEDIVHSKFLIYDFFYYMEKQFITNKFRYLRTADFCCHRNKRVVLFL